MMAIIDNFIFLFTESAAYLLLGLLLAGIICMLVADSWITRFLGANSSVVTAAINEECRHLWLRQIII
ncbi:MAG: uncharacterized membrane protein YraQ (UPF0718 family) [Oleispira sp.]|jgi:uncharacterized membrane protein YraQ (UPF0718 family)